MNKKNAQPSQESQAQIDTKNINIQTLNLQERLNLAYRFEPLVKSAQKIRVLQYIHDNPNKLTHQINMATSCGNISHVVTVKARPLLLKFGIAMYCYYPKKTHKTQFGEPSRVCAWRAELLENYDASKYGRIS